METKQEIHNSDLGFVKFMYLTRCICLKFKVSGLHYTRLKDWHPKQII
jgi:hypothetical protein